MKLTQENLQILRNGLPVLKEAFRHIANKNKDQDMIDRLDTVIVKYENIFEGEE